MFQSSKHLQSRTAGVVLVVRNIHRRIPKGHDAIPHILINSALLIQDYLGQRRQKAIQQLR